MRIKLTFMVSMLLMSLMAMSQQKTYTKAELDASNIIRLCNSVIELSNKNRTSADNYKSMLSTAESNLSKLKRNPNVQPFFVNYKNFEACFGDQKEYAAAYKGAPEFAEKKDIANTITLADKNIANAVKWATAMSDYFSEKEYLTDTEFAKYPAMQDSLAFYFQKGYTGWSEASRLASKAGNDAELILLQKSKIAEFIIPMKSDLNALEAILELFNQEAIDSELVKAGISAASKSIAQNKDISTKDVKKLSDVYYKEVFQNFYRKSEEALKAMDALNLELETNPKSDRLNNLYSSAMSNYRGVVEAYNTFIGQ
ncbi:hypothetical protein [Dysgonomonas sp. GY617]|uniref:hypothetical protein n=1 Tax=Dysgonomonas sp. GY617 TaxID=2780420 RepID=UPI0018838552|nr:hypothetical protein [Dysgonomonas sp. GY617]MBF0574505.1 hypothetical protein [Dysgonomonas sp. GY617]